MNETATSILHMKSTPHTYTVLAIERDSIRVSRHGISKLIGGRIVACDTYDNMTPYCIAEDQMKELYPGCRIVIKANP